MIVRTTLSLTPCLALFLLACNGTPTQPPAQSQATPSQTPTPKDQPSDQTATTAAESAKPSATGISGSPSPHHHHVAYHRHHRIARHTDLASADHGNAAAPEPAPAAPTFTVPTGTILSVRLTQELTSKTSNAGDAFTAAVAEDVMVDGKALIPQGSTVSGKVTEATPMGTLHSGVLQVTLDSINLNGEDQAIHASTESAVEKANTASAGDLVKNAAAGGSSGGGLAGAANTGALGGANATGALGGAASSGALGGGGLKTEAEAKAGTVVAALTGNRDLVFPVQTSVKFTLEQPLDIKP